MWFDFMKLLRIVTCTFLTSDCRPAINSTVNNKLVVILLACVQICITFPNIAIDEDKVSFPVL